MGLAMAAAACALRRQARRAPPPSVPTTHRRQAVPLVLLPSLGNSSLHASPPTRQVVDTNDSRFAASTITAGHMVNSKLLVVINDWLLRSSIEGPDPGKTKEEEVRLCQLDLVLLGLRVPRLTQLDYVIKKILGTNPQ